MLAGKAFIQKRLFEICTLSIVIAFVVAYTHTHTHTHIYIYIYIYIYIFIIALSSKTYQFLTPFITYIYIYMLSELLSCVK